MSFLTSFSYFIFALVVSSGVSISSCSADPPYTSPVYNDNVIVAFFDEAQLQIETLDQRQELARALQDMLTLAPDELRVKRYANYQLEPGKWTLNDILSRYYYARPPLVFDQRLYDDVVTADAKAKIIQALNYVKNGYPADSF